jgi:transcription elongation factor Elf1
MYVDLKYLKFIPLQQFTDKGDRKFNFRCPICGDSHKSSTKKRCWAFEHQNTLFIKCFNCEYSNSFQQFLKNEYPTFYGDYIREKFADQGHVPKKQSTVDLFASEYETLSLQLISSLPSKHPAVQYLQKRKMTEEMYKDFYYSDNFSLWVNTEIEENGINYHAESDRRIVIPFFSKYKKIFALQGRTIDNADPKYITFKMDKGCDKIYGLDRVDFSKKVYVVEGPIDSHFLDNCLATGGSLGELNNILKYTSLNNIVVVPDNDIRNKQTSRFIEDAINLGFNMVIWKKNTPFKDINEGIQQGLTKEVICSIIDKYTYSGLMALSKYKLRSFN